MYLGIYRFDGDPGELLASHERLAASMRRARGRRI
jgi:hypothetical protein